jgi:hypothetical protein
VLDGRFSVEIPIAKIHEGAHERFEVFSRSKMCIHPRAPHLFDLQVLVVRCMGVGKTRMVHQNELLKDLEAAC